MSRKPVDEMEHVTEISDPEPGYIYVDRDEETVNLEKRFTVTASDTFLNMKADLETQNAEIRNRGEDTFSVIGYEAYYKFIRRDGQIEIHSKEGDLTHLGNVFIEA